MNKAVSVIAGIVIVVGAVASAGAWYTGTQVEGVIRESVAQANQQLQERMVGDNGPASVEVTSLERHWFSSDVHYKLVLGGRTFAHNGQPLELDFVDHLEHGPLPLSRVKQLNLLPVMVASQFELVRTPTTEQWFAATHDASPLQGRSSISYARNAQIDLNFLPVALEAAEGPLRFSGATLHITASGDGQKLESSVNMDELQVTVATQKGPMTLSLKGLSGNSGGTKGRSGFFLGHTDARVALLNVQTPGNPAMQLHDFNGTSLTQEVEGNLAGQMTYDVGSLSFDGKPVGSLHLSGKLSNFDIAASQALAEFYRTKVAPQAMAANTARAAGKPYDLNLAPADQLQFKALMTTLLAGKPHVELEKLAFKTSHSESQVNLALDLANPGTFDQPQAELYKKMIADLKAQVLLSKPMVADLVTLQAQAQGLTDPAALAKQAQGTVDTLAGVAQVFELGKIEGDDIVSRLHYADGMVDFNGQKMTPEQFATWMVTKVQQVAPR